MHWLESSSTQEHGLDFADFIGVESCIDLQDDINIEPYSQRIKKKDHQCEIKKEKKEKEYPPPIPWLAWTGNLSCSQMPWVMKRYYTEDGRLIIKEEKVECYEYFEAHRSNGRLTLNLIPLNDDVSDDDNEEEFLQLDEDIIHNCEEKEEENGDNVNKSDNDHDGFHQRNGELRGEDELTFFNGSAVIGGGGTKCSISLCMFGLAMPTIRPVHT